MIANTLPTSTDTTRKVIVYVSLRKHAGQWAPRTDGIDASSEEYRRLIRAGWLPQKGWTATEVEPGVHQLDDLTLPVRQYPREI
jgi:hypothetical protein